MWLNKSKALAEAVRVYNSESILPDPEAFGLDPSAGTAVDKSKSKVALSA